MVLPMKKLPRSMPGGGSPRSHFAVDGEITTPVKNCSVYSSCRRVHQKIGRPSAAEVFLSHDWLLFGTPEGRTERCTEHEHDQG